MRLKIAVFPISAAFLEEKVQSQSMAFKPEVIMSVDDSAEVSYENAKRYLEKKTFYLFVKRTVDIFISLVSLVLLTFPFALIGAAIRIDSHGPVFFRQERVGRYGRIFKIYKFRTMRENAPRTGGLYTISGDTRITRVGAFLRRYKLDELPQLINVLRGDMSLVGPRPLVKEHAAYYGDWGSAVALVRPGMTGSASLEYRDEETILLKCKDPAESYKNVIIPHKRRLNMEYINNLSFKNDVRLIYDTVTGLIGRRAS